MFHIDKITNIDQNSFVRGWIYEQGKQVANCRFEAVDTKLHLSGFGKPSSDLVEIFGEDASHSRFEFVLPLINTPSQLIFEYVCGTSTTVNLNEWLISKDLVVPQTHQIVHGRYRGKFELSDEMEVQEVGITSRHSAESESVQVAANNLNFDSQTRCLRFTAALDLAWNVDDLVIVFYLKDGRVYSIDDIGNKARSKMYPYELSEKYFLWLENSPKNLSIIELGARARSGNTFRHRIPSRHKYVGADIIAGENVDIIADAHVLSNHVEPGSFDAAFGVSVFEHFAMPWKVAIELNRILKMGGRGMFFTHQSWPVHDAPFDFWRFSKESWYAIFNASSGFRVVHAAVGDEARLFAECQIDQNQLLSKSVGYLASCVVVEKTSETSLFWDVPLEDVYRGNYPE